MNKIIIIGSGARECSILMKLKQSPQEARFEFITIGTNINPYMFKQSNFIFVEDYSTNTITSLNVFRNDVFMVIIGLEGPIVGGLENKLRENGIFTLAPSRDLSKIEWSKIYARNLLDTSSYLKKFNPFFGDLKNQLGENITRESLVDSILKFRTLNNSKVVIKKDGLCGGKGVFVEDDHFTIISREDFLESKFIADLIDYILIENNNILLEEKLEGIEFSLMSLVDQNENFVHFDPVFDYKRLENGDKGANTGSMGAVLLDYESQKKVIGFEAIQEAKKVNEATVIELNLNLNERYKGVLYGSFILLPNNTIKVIEFNCRFGDPEGVLTLMNTHNDLISVFSHVQTKTLNKVLLKSKNLNIVGVYLVPENYGLPVKKNDRFDIFFRGNMKSVHESVLNNRIFSDLSVVYGSCDMINNNLRTASSRTILVTSGSDYLYKSYNMVYRNIDNIVSNLKYRMDIGERFISKYESAGISIDNANSSIVKIKNALNSTYNQNVESDLGDFGGVYNLEGHQLVSSIDGVGTKTDFVDNYFKKSDYYSLGQDIVNHCINDILVMGAQPLFFLDYYGTSMLNGEQFQSFVEGACFALRGEKGTDTIPLIGGETAEMPSVYNTNKNDVVGCIIGKLNRSFVSFPRSVQKGDILYGIESVGPHTNGFSLINRVDWRAHFLQNKDGCMMSDMNDFLNTLKTPHKSYYELIKYFTNVYGNDSLIRMCHITGGGLHENLRRVVPDSLKLNFNSESLNSMYPSWCKTVEVASRTSREEMYRVFNCGIGFVLIISPEIQEKIESEKKFKFTQIGFIE